LFWDWARRVFFDGSFSHADLVRLVLIEMNRRLAQPFSFVKRNGRQSMDTKRPAVERHNAPLALVGDFGGTNVRLALANLGGDVPAIGNVRHYRTRDFARAVDTITAYMADTSEKPSVAVIAAAGPVDHGAVHFTNLGWTLTEEELTQSGFAAARIVNDFVAAALATQLLGAADLHEVGSGITDRHRNAAVMGPGTGFGASALVMDNDGNAVPIAAEGGHASFAPDDDVEIEVLRYLAHRLGHVSIERILSGPGLCSLHEALNAIEGVTDTSNDAPGDPQTITRRALAGEKLSTRTLMRFCAIMGGVAGNLALTYGAQGGVYIAGGIAPGILSILDRSEFRARFESKGRFVDYLRSIATQVIIRSDAAFLGAAHAARGLRQGLAATPISRS
jgi:glucokinase